jgi:hypothetical protein
MQIEPTSGDGPLDGGASKELAVPLQFVQPTGVRYRNKYDVRPSRRVRYQNCSPSRIDPFVSSIGKPMICGSKWQKVMQDELKKAHPLLPESVMDEFRTGGTIMSVLGRHPYGLAAANYLMTETRKLSIVSQSFVLKVVAACASPVFEFSESTERRNAAACFARISSGAERVTNV